MTLRIEPLDSRPAQPLRNGQGYMLPRERHRPAPTLLDVDRHLVRLLDEKHFKSRTNAMVSILVTSENSRLGLSVEGSIGLYQWVSLGSICLYAGIAMPKSLSSAAVVATFESNGNRVVRSEM